ncbi:hypothetical protein L2E82_18625 [Cichorium intybus]|uniref:Uncharacterized protein n=1 Tax=Cichorium intybus TaxID=13427 RepID=A0ACB9FAM8_CICIN|nr:hypothetical protein L2E82_18625 [Cichorium intybus]
MLFNRTTLLLLPTLLIIFGVFSLWIGDRSTFFSSLDNYRVSLEAKWRGYTLPEAFTYVAKNGSTMIVCAVSQPYLLFLNNWLISIVKQKHHEEVLVIAEDYATLYTVNGWWLSKLQSDQFGKVVDCSSRTVEKEHSALPFQSIKTKFIKNPPSKQNLS